MLGMTVWTSVCGAVRVDVLKGLALVITRGEGDWRRGGVRHNERSSPSSGFHDHLQSSIKGDMASGGPWVSLSCADASSAPLCRCCVLSVAIPDGDARVGGTKGPRKGVGRSCSLGEVSNVSLSGGVRGEGVSR